MGNLSDARDGQFVPGTPFYWHGKGIETRGALPARGRQLRALAEPEVRCSAFTESDHYASTLTHLGANVKLKVHADVLKPPDFLLGPTGLNERAAQTIPSADESVLGPGVQYCAGGMLNDGAGGSGPCAFR